MGGAESQVHNCKSIYVIGRGKWFSLLPHSLSTKGVVDNYDKPQNNFSQRINRVAISMHGFNITAKFWLQVLLSVRKHASYINVQQRSMWRSVVAVNSPHSYFQQQKFRLCSQTFSKVLLSVMQLSVSECTMITVSNQKNSFVTRESCPQLFYKYAGLPQLTSDIQHPSLTAETVSK